jgi:hypothetical protein
MKRVLFSVAGAMAVALCAGKLHAERATTLETVTPDWHYRWHEGRWWYWMPDSRWMVWTGSTWVPFEQFSVCPQVLTASQAVPYSASYGSYDRESQDAAPEPAYSNTGDYRPSYSGRSGADYSGYGWSWGPGTAFRDTPGRRF